MNNRYALLFDLDGTLIDSAPDLAAALNRVLALHGRKMLPYPKVRGMIGNGAMKLVERGFQATGDPAANLQRETERFLKIYLQAVACHTKVYEGVDATLDLLAKRGHALAVATNKPLVPTRAVLDELRLSRYFHPDAVVGGDSFTEKKPSAIPILGLLKRIGAEPERSVMIGDTINDVQAAKAAGIPSIAVKYGYSRGPADELGADILIDRFADLPNALAEISGRP